MKKIALLATAVFTVATVSSLINRSIEDPITEWREYLGGPDRNHYSTLTQINPENVSKLQVAWTYSTPDSGQMQVNPIIVDGVLYGVTSSVQAFALHWQRNLAFWRPTQKLGKYQPWSSLLAKR